MRAKRSGQRDRRNGFGILLAGCLVCFQGGAVAAWSQAQTAAADPQGTQISSPLNPGALARWERLPVRRIAIEGIEAERLALLPDRLAQVVGAPLTEENLAKSLRQLFATGLFETIAAEGVREGDGIALVFKGTPRTFIGTVTVDGAKGPTINTQLQRASGLSPGTRFTQARFNQALDQMRQTLADNGFHEPMITHTLTANRAEQLVDIAFHVVSGPQARVGAVEVTGDSGMSVSEFRRLAHLRAGERVEHETVNRALSGVLKHYQHQDRLEAEIKLVAQVYAPDTDKTSYHFTANRGPVVKVRVEGASISADRVRRAVPVFEEGTVDDDLLNEGNRRLRNYFQVLGYFDVKVEYQRLPPQPDAVEIVYTVTLGPRRRVERVAVSGNHYFNTSTLKDLLSVHVANSLDHHGAYNQALVEADISALRAVYQNNGFSRVKIASEISLVKPGEEGQSSARASRKPAGLAVTYRIEEGVQQRVGTVRLEGNDHVEAASLTPLLNTAPGQLLSPQNLAGDRDALLTDYFSRGFDKAQVDVAQQLEPADANKVNVVFHVTEGPQIFVRKVLLTGLHYTRPSTIAKAITLHPGAPLSQTALAETQRNLYDFALFNEVNTAVENPSGGTTHKTVLLQVTEARRWALTYGLGFEAQTGTPQNNCASAIAGGAECNPNGKTGISPRVLMDVTRNNLFGREQSASIQGTYGLLEQKVDLRFQNPHFFGNRNFGLTLSGGYANSQDVTTYVASKLQGSMRWTENFNVPGSLLSKANTLVYELDFRRVKVTASSLQVFPGEISLLSQAVRVAGPGVTWIRDTRDSPLDAHRGTYTSFQEFISSHAFGSQTQFNRLDLSNSSFYGFAKNRFVLARNTRYAQERAFGEAPDELIPLPERLYAGGPASLRGFSINAAGPRDPQTGYPVGGAGALVNSTELRLPPPTLPLLGNSLSFVLFEDMGNVFRNAGDAWASALRIQQPDRDACKVLTPPQTTNGQTTVPPPTGPITSTGQQGQCSFNYFSHAAGLGLRYHTPVGPIRLDFSYNLNPPIYPVDINYSLTPYYLDQHVGQANHFNFFFSLGQTF
ncbi:MAG: POTRA domain-containing protein [Terracidiphilus sp.]